MNPIKECDRLEFGGDAHNSGPDHPLVLVFGSAGIREDVRSKLVDFGIDCASAEDPASVVFGHDARILGWVGVGADAVSPSISDPLVWCIRLCPDGLPSSALRFCWPGEALPFVCTVLALRDRAHDCAPTDIAIQQRVWVAIHDTSVPRGNLRVQVVDGVVSLSGCSAGPFMHARMCALAREVPGVVGVQVYED